MVKSDLVTSGDGTVPDLILYPTNTLVKTSLLTSVIQETVK